MIVQPIEYPMLKDIAINKKKNGLVFVGVTGNYNDVINKFIKDLTDKKIIKNKLKDISELFSEAYVITSKTNTKSLILLLNNMFILSVPALQNYKNNYSNIIYLTDFINNFDSEFKENSNLIRIKKIQITQSIKIGNLQMECGDFLYIKEDIK